MNLGELRAEARILLDDPEMPGEGDPSGVDADHDSLWKNADLNRWFNEAVDEACIRARLLRDSTTPQVCEISVLAGVTDYTLHESIFGVFRARLASLKEPLSLQSAAPMDSNAPHWQSWEPFEPQYAVCDLNSYKLTLAPEPVEDDTLLLTVWRVTLDCEQMEKDDRDSPAIHAMHHPHLFNWVLHKAYSVKDAETHDPQLSEKYEAIFERRFGPRPNAQTSMDNQHQRNRRAGAHYF